jgi:hypothetical protein
MCACLLIAPEWIHQFATKFDMLIDILESSKLQKKILSMSPSDGVSCSSELKHAKIRAICFEDDITGMKATP